MRPRNLAVLLISCALSGVAFAQTQAAPSAMPPHHKDKPKPGPVATALPASADSVGMNDPVVTLKGACQAPDAAKTGCVDVITREQFEKLANALKPDMPADAKRNFATNYGKMLVFANAARALGLENDPKVQQVFQFAQNQILVDALNQHYSEEYAHPTDQQIQDYYNQNIGKYREATLQRIIVPTFPANGDKPKPSEAEQKAYVEKLRQKWVEGGDPATLQKEAFAWVGMTGAAPEVDLSPRQPGSLPQSQADVFQLKPGEVSQPFTDAAASYIYKMVSVRQIPLADVKNSIAKDIHNQELRDKIMQISESMTPELNEAYFGPEKSASMAPEPGNPGPEGASAPAPKPQQ